MQSLLIKGQRLHIRRRKGPGSNQEGTEMENIMLVCMITWNQWPRKC